MKACILIRTEKGEHDHVADQIFPKMGDKGVEDAIRVFGPAEVVVRAEVDDYHALEALVADIQNISGVLATETLPELATPGRGAV